MSAAVPRPMRRLQAARLVGAAVLAILGERVLAGAAMTGVTDGGFLAITVPPGVSLGAAYSVTVALISVACALGILFGRRWATTSYPLLLTLHIGVFVPLLAQDAPVAGVVILWNSLLLGDHLFSLSLRSPRGRRGSSGDDTDLWLARQGAAARHLLLLSVLATMAVGGFDLTESAAARYVCLGLDVGVLILTAPFVLAVFRQRRRYLVALALLLAVGLPPALDSLPALLSLLGIFQAGVLALMLGRSEVFTDLLRSFYTRPALLILSTFAGLAGAGALILTSPAASAGPYAISFIDALFTSMSATCVTGLIVLDTPVAFSSFGHLVILLLIQLGGLGIMVLSTFATVLLGGRLALRGEQALEEMLDLSSPGSAYELTRFIVISTLLIEALGAALLALSFHYHYGYEPLEALWRGVFHAVSAFCNAGFSLWSDSLIQFQRDAFVQGVHMVLITCGGLGFTVLAALWLKMRGKAGRQSLQTKVVLVTSLGLTVGGAILYAVTEWDASLQALPSVGEKVMNALFQSVSLRTAGFNTLDYGGLERSTIMMMIVWMFIGASPGSTGGGIKTTTFAVMLAAIPALLRSQPRALLFRRMVPHDIIYRAATIMTLATMVAVLITFLLLATHSLPFDKVIFETVSALATVGLSIGATAELDAFGKWAICMTMFVGRVGPVSLALALSTPRQSQISFPEAKIMVG
jgi:trk system potassium uptake protein TrkH